MPVIEIKVPQLAESIAEATLLQWHKKVGEAVARDENLIDIETDKVVLELPAPADGVLTEILKGDGETVVAEEVIARLDTEAKPTAAPEKAAATDAAAAAPAQAAATASAAAAAPSAPAAAGGPKGDIAMPAAAKMLREAQMSPSQVSGTGRDGRVTKGDVLGAIARGTQQAAPAAAPAAPAPARAPLPEVRPAVD